MVSLRVLSALLLLGGMVYGLLSGNWGIGAIAFGLAPRCLGSSGSAQRGADPNAPSGGCSLRAGCSSWWTP